jgi:hypothetical protein
MGWFPPTLYSISTEVEYIFTSLLKIETPVNHKNIFLHNWVFTEFEQADKKSSDSSNELDRF